MDNELAAAIRASAQRLGVDPLDLGTTVSYETGGTFDPWQAGPTTQYGQHRGLIQWGEPQRAKYGVTQGMPVAAQMEAAERYLQDAGVRPGMGLMDIYSAVNAGRVGRYGASDANNGGAPGTVADKVNNQMSGHRQNAERLLGDLLGPAMAQSAPNGQPRPPGPPSPPAPPGPNGAAQPTQQAGFAAPSIGGLPANISQIAGLFVQNQQANQQRQEQDAEAEQLRRLALFGGADGGGLWGA